MFNEADEVMIELKKINSQKYIPKERDYPSDFMKYIQLGINPHIFIESIMNIYLDCRKVTCCYWDQTRLNSRQQILKLAENLKKDYDIYLGLITFSIGEGFESLFFFFKDFRYYLKLNNLQKLIKEQSNNQSNVFDISSIIKELGIILDYPKCCIDFFASTRGQGLSIEDSLCKMIIEDCEKKNNANSQAGVIEFFITPYFTLEFYPCSPQCTKAKLIGDSILDKFNRIEPKLAKAFNLALGLNLNRILNPNLNLEENLLLRQKMDNEIYGLFVKEQLVTESMVKRVLKGLRRFFPNF